jgi:hypothetical protein
MQALVAACHLDCGRVVLLVCDLDSAPLNTPAKYVAAILHLPHLSAVALARQSPSANYANSISPEGYGLLRCVVCIFKCLYPYDDRFSLCVSRHTNKDTERHPKGFRIDNMSAPGKTFKFQDNNKANAPRIPDKRWDDMKEIILELYKDMNMTLAEVKVRMEQEHGFSAT